MANLANWRAAILREFVPQIARLTLVADPDGLLQEEGVLQGIRERGYDLIPFEDPVAFRYAYEARYRSRWDRGEDTDLVVLLRAPRADLRALPYDLLLAGRQLAFSLVDLFPNLSYPVVAALDRADLDALFEAQRRHQPGRLGDNATADFILRHVFELAPDEIPSPTDLLRALLRRHYRGLRVPPALDARLIDSLRQNPALADWPLERIVSRREDFLAFLQERWPLYLERLALQEDPSVHEPAPTYEVTYAGPRNLPFDHPDVRPYVDSLFLDGALRPVPHRASAKLAGQRVAVGLALDPRADRLRRLEGLVETAEGSLPSNGARHQDWLAFAQRWAEIAALRLALGPSVPDGLHQRMTSLRREVDARFRAWLACRYPGLHNQPALPPVMVHHLPRAVARALVASGKERVALIVIDGLALDQWVSVREVLAVQLPGLRTQESAVFAWVPTITSVSRQALFAGKPPLYFPTNIRTTDHESALWGQFWADQGAAAREVAYAKGLGEDTDLQRVDDLIGQPRVRVIGLVIDTVDRIMHGMQLGSAGMHNQIRQWADAGSLAKLLDRLHERGFVVHLTSDHGNIEAVGVGRPSEGAIVDLTGSRARVYPDVALLNQVRTGFPDALPWPPVGLPDDFLPLLAPGRSAFAPRGETVVGHGGASIEEVIVPFVRFRWAQA